MAFETQFRFVLSAAVSAIALSGSIPALAQEVRGPEREDATVDALAPTTIPSAMTEPADRVGLEAIVVTARKVSENLQDVPVAVTAFSGEELQRQSAVTLTNVARLTPGLRAAPGTTPGASIFTVRGQTGNTAASQDSAVGIYVDGLYWARAVGLDVDLLDVQSVQILKGPQGTLFGRNTTGGAVILQSNDPTFEFDGLISATYGRFNERRGTAVINVPIVDDKLALRVAGSINKRDGYIENAIGGPDLDERNSWNGRAKLLAKPTDNVSVLLSAEIWRSNALGQPFRPVYISPTSSLNQPVGIAVFGPVTGETPEERAASAAQRTAQGRAYLADYVNRARSSDVIGVDYVPRNYAKTQTYSATGTIDTFFGAIKMIAGYRKLDSNGDLDFDGTPFPILFLPYKQVISQKSMEAQITGKAFGGALDFAGGAFYFKENGLDQSPFNAFGALTQFDGSIETHSMGLYGQGTLHLSDRLSFTGGLRYSVEDKGIVNRNRAANGTCALLVASLPDCIFKREDEFSGISYTAGLEYRFSDDVLAYAKTSRAFRSGGQNLRAAGALEATTPFGPEQIVAYEAGVKSEFLDRRVRLNLSGFLNIGSDLQRNTITNVVVGGANTAVSIASNFGKARFYGGEAELTAQLTDGFVFSATTAYINSEYIDFIDPNTGVDRRYEFFADPEFSFSLAATHTHDLPFGVLEARADYSWTGKQNLGPNNPTDPLNADKIAASTVDGGGVLNGRLGLRVLDDSLEVAGFVRNATNNRKIVLANQQPAGFGATLVLRREPRTFGLTATYRFGQR